MTEFLIGSIIVAVGAAGLFWLRKPFSAMERRHLWAGLAAYLFAAVFKIWLVVEYYGGTGDMMMYRSVGLELAGLMHHDFALYGPEIARLFFQWETVTGLEILGYGSSTASMSAILAVVFYLFGESFYIASMVLALFSFFTSVGMYWAFRQVLAEDFRRALLWACILLPSGVFWTGGFSKELFAVAGLGILLLGCQVLFLEKKRWFIGVFLTVVGAWLVSLFKAFLLIGVIAGAAGFYYAARQQRLETTDAQVFKPFYLAAALLVVVVGFVVIGEVFPRFSPEQMVEEMAHGQEAGARGGSAIQIGDPTQRSLAGQLAFAPVALFNSLFRPFLFEAHNPVSLANALEMTVLTILLALGLKRFGVRRSLRLLTRSPVLLGCVAMVLILAVGVGLATANLGSLSRYRAPMMPFWVVIIGVLYIYGKRAVDNRIGVPAEAQRPTPVQGNP